MKITPTIIHDDSHQMCLIPDQSVSEFEYCLVGNIVEKHDFEQNKEIRYGSKHFRGSELKSLMEFSEFINNYNNEHY